MKVKCEQSGISLIEMTVVVAIIAMLAVFGLPAIDAFFNSMGSAGSAKAMISAALSAARAIAAREQRYAGIRFQKAYNPDSPLKAEQYMVFIIQDPNLSLPNGWSASHGFRAVQGLKPMKLSNGVGVMEVVNSNIEVNNNGIKDKTTFSIIFSPSGKLVIHDVQALRKNSYDSVFNDPNNLPATILEDDYSISSPVQKESSRNSFIIYDQNKLLQVAENRRWSDYLSKLDKIYINPYTGTIISGE